MALIMPKHFESKLDMFFADKVCADIDRSTINHIALEDKENKVTICLIFMRDWDVIEYDDYNQIIMEKAGAVFIFPAYWLCVPKQLSMPYFLHIIGTFYSDYVSKWVGNGSDDSNNGNNGGNGCGCGGCKPPCNPGYNNQQVVVNPGANFGGFI